MDPRDRETQAVRYSVLAGRTWDPGSALLVAVTVLVAGLPGSGAALGAEVGVAGIAAVCFMASFEYRNRATALRTHRTPWWATANRRKGRP